MMNQDNSNELHDVWERTLIGMQITNLVTVVRYINIPLPKNFTK